MGPQVKERKSKARVAKREGKLAKGEWRCGLAREGAKRIAWSTTNPLGGGGGAMDGCSFIGGDFQGWRRMGL